MLHWHSSTSCLGPSPVISGTSTLPSVNVTQCFDLVELGGLVHSPFMVPLWHEVSLDASWFPTVLPWYEVAWELSPHCPEDLDLLWLAEHWHLVEYWWLVEQPILSSMTAATARVHCWASLASAIISL